MKLCLYLAGIGAEFFSTDGKTNERHALNCLSSQESQLRCVRITDHKLQQWHKPKINSLLWIHYYLDLTQDYHVLCEIRCGLI